MKILIVEDEREIREFLKRSLKAESFEVDVAEDGERGSYLARTGGYDLVILDNVLPKKNGFEVCKEVRLAGVITPILMLSVRSGTGTKVDLLDAGADDYLVKPFSLDELLARIRALLRRPQRVEGDVLRAGDLTVDTRRQSVRKNGKDVYLTRKEFMLLEYLMRNRGTVLSRHMILEHVWDMNADPFSNTIEAHIMSLRKKIGSKGRRGFIRTVPGRGYVVDE